MLAGWNKLMIAALLLPALMDPANNPLFLPMAMGLIEFSIKLLSIGNWPSPMNRVRATNLFNVESIALARADPSEISCR
jgi:hypothetical protein